MCINWRRVASRWIGIEETTQSQQKARKKKRKNPTKVQQIWLVVEKSAKLDHHHHHHSVNQDTINEETSENHDNDPINLPTSIEPIRISSSTLRTITAGCLLMTTLWVAAPCGGVQRMPRGLDSIIEEKGSDIYDWAATSIQTAYGGWDVDEAISVFFRGKRAASGGGSIVVSGDVIIPRIKYHQKQQHLHHGKTKVKLGI